MTEESILKIKSDDSSVDGRFFKDVHVEFIIHELKDPISVIETALRMLLEKKDKYGLLTDRQEKTLKRALRNSKKARNLLADLLEVGRSEAGCFQCCRFNPMAAIDEVLMEVLEASDADLWEALQEAGPGPDQAAVLKEGGIHVACSEGVHCVEFCQDEAKFRQIVSNLVKNALQHRRRWLEIGVDCRGAQMIIEVADDGPGVEQAHQELIFKRYTRLETGVMLSRTGHGLGLAGSRILARHLGGDITVKNVSGRGAAFCFTLPLQLHKNW